MEIQTEHPRTRRLSAAITGVLLLGVFLLDLAIPLGFATGVLYVLAVIASLWHAQSGFTYAVAFVASVLTIVGFLIPAAMSAVAWAVIANRGLALFAIWATAVLGVRVRQAGERLQSNENRTRAIVETAVEAIVTIDRDGIIQSFNRAAEHMFGYAAAEVLGRNVNRLMPSPYQEEHDGYIERYLRTGEARIIGIGREVTARRKDGSTFPIELAVSQSDHVQMFTGFIRDISDRREAEERLRQADRLSSIGTLAAGLGHDMNNVLLPVRARLDLVEQAELPSTTRKHITEIRKSAKYLQDLADGLHLLALDPEDREASSESTTLTQWWEQVRALLARALPKHVRFAASIPSDLPPLDVAPHRLTQAVLNMLVNSAKAVGEEGRVRLWAEADDGNGAIRIGVTDNGCGMSPEVKRRALEPFFTTKTRGLGTGLGLSLVHGVVKSAGGTVEINSEPGRGTTIILNFPAAEEPLPTRDLHHTREQAPLAVVSLGDRRVQSLVLNLLEMSGFEAVPGEVHESDDTALWVTEASAETIVYAQRYATGNRRVILLGSAPEGFREPGIVFVDSSDDFDALRAAING